MHWHRLSSPRPALCEWVPILWGDMEHDDRRVLQHLLHGGAAYDMRTASMIVAPTLKHLPPGVYRTAMATVVPERLVRDQTQ